MLNESSLQEQIDKLKTELLEFKKRTRYGLVWVDVPEAFDNEAEHKLPILEEVKNLAIANNDGKPTHILIEGDNYHALTCLNYTHKEAVDVIYIDPPYNTGSDGFRYKDKRIYKQHPDGTEVPKNHPLRHSYWLSFMAKRLELAKNLLKDTGVIFISIDDNEIAQLKLLCDGIFGEDNFAANFIWKSRQIIDSRNKNNISNDHEYILVFSKNVNYLKLKGKGIDIAKYTNPDDDERDVWMSNSILGLATKEQRPNLHYDIIDPETGNAYECPPNTGWRYSQETIKRKIKEKRIVFPKELNGRPREKKFLSEAKSEFTGFSSILSEKIGYTLNGTREVRDILESSVFSFPKPKDLIKTLINQNTTNDTPSVILDFFAGSGTTAQAVMELNKEDGGNRQCILVTDNEKEICTKVCYPRVQRVIEGYAYSGNKETILLEKKLTWTDFNKNDKLLKQIESIEQVNRVYPEYDKITKDIKNGILKVAGVNAIEEKVAGLGNSLKYYRTAFVGNHNAPEATDQDKTALAHKAGYLLALAENTLVEKEATEFYQIFMNDTEGVATGVYFKEYLSEFDNFKDKIIDLNKPATVYVFDWGNGESFEASFEEQKHIEVKSVPNPIVNIYKAIFVEPTPITEETI